MNFSVLQRLLLIKQTLFGVTWLGASALLPYLQKNTPHFSLSAWLLLLLAFVSARFSGMCFNGFFDRQFDAKNPRTKDRPLPLGEISPVACLMLAIVFLGLFFCASWAINPLCGLLSLLIGAIVVLYSLTKRITYLCHIALGSVYFFAPLCAWAAVTGEMSVVPLLFGGAFFFSIVASDIIYACQDVEFDRKMGLFSVPAMLGSSQAHLIAALLHTASIVCLCLESFFLGSTLLLVATFLVTGVYAFSYLLLLRGQISYMAAFSRMNTLSGLILFIFIVGAVWRALS